MPNIDYTSIDFSTFLGQDFQGGNNLRVTWAEIIWAAITVGKIDRNSLLQFGHFSLFDIINRITTIYANLRENQQGQIVKTDLYNHLDPSEKSAVSYFLGLTLAKVFCSRLLNTPWLAHLDIYKMVGNNNLTLIKKSKPDLIGLDKNRKWTVLESKGRTNGITSNSIVKAKNQTRQLRKINGSFPNLRVAAATYFENNILKFTWADPEDINEGQDHNFKIFDFLTAYYSPFKIAFQNIASDQEGYQNNFILLSLLDEFDLTLGIDSRLLNDELDYSFIFDVDYPKSIEREFYGGDGIFLKLGEKWNIENLKKQPSERE